METSPIATSSSSLHPLLWVAGISVTLLSLAGIASLTGFLPARTAPVPERPAVVAAAPVAAPAAEPVAAPVVPAAPVATTQAPAVAVGKTPPAIHQAAAKKKVERDIPASPPPAGSGVPRDYVPPHAGSGVPPDYVPSPATASAPAPCLDCGVVSNVRQVTNEGKPTGAGAVIGGLAGAALGSNVGSGNTRTVASIAGAVGGGLLGNSIEKSQRQTTSYEVTLHMEDGSTRTIAADTLPSWRIGDKVKLVGGAIVSR